MTLAEAVGTWGDDFTATVFDDEAAGSIISELPPFTGHFRPAGSLSALDGSAPGGAWTLQVKDERARYAGALGGWELDVTTCSDPVPQVSQAAGASPVPPLPSGVPTGAEGTEGTLITVTNDSEVVNGTTSTVSGLQADPGADGISLPEAIAATNNDPGTYTIRFAPGLAGTTITLGNTYRLSGGGVFIDGDIGGDGRPDITIAETDGYLPFELISGDNRLHALAIQGSPYGVGLFSEGNPTNSGPIARNVVSGLELDVASDGVVSNTGGGPAVDTWSDDRFVGNTIDSQGGGIELLQTGHGDVVQRMTVAGNRIHLAQPGGEVTADAVSFGVGLASEDAGFANDGNQFLDGVAAYNTVTGDPGSGIVFRSGELGSKHDVIDGARVLANRFDFSPAPGERSMPAIGLGAGDGASDFACPLCTPIVYSDDNVIRDVEIRGNSLAHTRGIHLQASCCGNADNVIENVRVRDNEIQGSAQSFGVGVFGGDADPNNSARPSAGNTVSNLTIDHNSAPSPTPPRREMPWAGSTCSAEGAARSRAPSTTCRSTTTWSTPGSSAST